MRSRKTILAGLALLALLLAACGAAQTAAPSALKGAPAVDAGRAELAAMPAPAPQQGQGGTQTVPVPLAFDPDRALILTANIALRAKDPWAIADRAQAIALGLGGDVMGLSQSGNGDQRSATLTLRVPSGRFNDALRQLKDISDVEVVSSSVEGRDVTDQFVDLQARLRAKQAEEQRYLALIARAEKIDDILRLDQALAQVRTQIEQLTGQINSIRSRTQFSTIVVSVSSAPVTPASDPKAYDPAKTMERAVAALAAMLRVLADVAIWTAVFGWLPLLALGIVVLLARTRRRAVPAA